MFYVALPYLILFIFLYFLEIEHFNNTKEISF